MVIYMSSKEQEWFVKHSKELSKKYHGKHIAIIGGKVVGVGETMLEAFRRAKERYPKKKISMAYIPTREETVTLL